MTRCSHFALVALAVAATCGVASRLVHRVMGQSAVPKPDARTLFQQSFTAMKTVRYVHTRTVVKGTTTTPASTFRLTVVGDCDAPGARLQTLKVRAHVRGAIPVTASPISPKIPNTNAEFIVITSSASARSWERSARTHSTWAVQTKYDPIVAQSYPFLLCPSILYQGMATSPSALKQFTFTNDGAEAIRGRPTWHITLEGSGPNGQYHFDFFIDQHTSYWLRTNQSITAKGVTGSVQGDHSGFNVPTHITPPKVGSVAR